MADQLARREFLAWLAAAAASSPRPVRGNDFPVRFREPSPCDELLPLIDPANDQYRLEREAAPIEAHLNKLIETRSLPLAGGFEGVSPLPASYREQAEVARAVFDQADKDFAGGLRNWLDSLGEVRRAMFFVLPEERVRFEVSSRRGETLLHRVGHWRMSWRDGRLQRFAPLDETLVHASGPRFRDITAELFRDAPSFHEQLARGVPYWRSRLDPASGISVFGNNGIAVGDVDGDGWDELYVCQPGGLPNRLYHRRTDGSWQDITEPSGVGVLDDTAQALFLDLRNRGLQDLLVLTSTRPLLFLNQGGGKYRHVPDAFRFANSPQGTFAGMSAADYDRDGKLDLYLCAYLYFQSEDQYRYPVPYHDAQNGPPNFLFHNRLGPDGDGYFQDVTAETGLDGSNNRYSFAAAWCDYDGDGWPDLYVANDFGRNNLYKNEAGVFRDVAAPAGVEDIGPGMSAAWFDYDGDGLLDLYVTNMWTASGQRVASDAAFGPARAGVAAPFYQGHMKGNSLYRNRGDGTFEDTAATQGVEMGRWSWAADGIDFDLDGVPEILVTAGMITHDPAKDLGSFFWRQVVGRSPAAATPEPAYETGWNCLNEWVREDHSWNGNEPNVFYVRRGDRYYDFSGISGLDAAADSRAFAVTDFDGDGRPDLFLKNRRGPQLIALRNDSAGDRHSLVIELEGADSNRDAIGAIVEVDWGSRRTAQVLSAGSGYISQHTKRLFFGQGQSKTARQVRVRWPSGAEQTFLDLAAGFRYRFREGSSEYEQIPFQKRRPVFPAARPVEPVNDLVLEPTWLLEPVPLPETGPGLGFLCLVDADSAPKPAGVPFTVLDLREVAPERAAAYALFRRYLFDYRTGLRLPLLFLVDEQSQVHKIYPSVPGAASLRQDLHRLREPDRARLALPFAGRYYSRPSRNHFRMGSAFLQAGYPEPALFYLKEVVSGDPRNFKAQLAIGRIHLNAGRYGEARRYLETAAKLSTDSPQLWNSFGGLEMAREDYAAALRYFDKALALNPNLAFVLVNAGQAYKQQGNLPAAEKALRRALEVEPEDADAANQLGLVLAGQGNTAEGVKAFQRAIAAQRDHAEAINNLAVLYIQSRQINDAIAAFRYGIEKAPNFETTYLNLARLYTDLGQMEKARQTLEQLLERQPQNAAARKALLQLP